MTENAQFEILGWVIESHCIIYALSFARESHGENVLALETVREEHGVGKKAGVQMPS